MHSDAQRASRRTRRPHRSRRVLAALLVPALGLGVGLTTGFGFFDSSGASDPPPLGIYIGYENTSGVSSIGSAMGQQPAYAMDYLDGTSWSSMESSASSEAAKWGGSGYSMTYSIPMLPNSGSSLADGAAGDYNAYWTTIAQNLVANNQGSSILRVGWEFNGNWYTWAANSSNQSQFVAFWQQIVTTMRAVPGANFKFEWCPTLGDQGIGNLANYYPGNAYVDEVAADVYDQSWGSYPGAAAEFSDIETETYGLNWLTSLAAQDGKEVAIGEWGLGTGPGNAGQAYSANNEQVSGGDDPTFINDMAQWLVTNHVYEASYFDDLSSTISSSENPNSYNALLKDFGPGGVAGSGSAAPAPAPAPAPTTTTTAPPRPTTTTTAPAPAPTTTTTAPAPTTTTTPPRPTTTTTTPTPAPHTTPTTVPTTTTTTTPPPAPGPPPGSMTVTTLSVSAGSASVGDESALKFTVTVTPAVNETIGIYGDGGLFKLCDVTISTANGSGTCALTNSELGPGLYLAGAITLSGEDYTGSFSNPVAFSIGMAS
jgi:Glycosyl hydrolase family 26